jgi:hypothetical protein
MELTREHLSRGVKPEADATDAPSMPGRRSILDRLAALLRRRDRRVLVLVNTTHGVRTVPVPARSLR